MSISASCMLSGVGGASYAANSAPQYLMLLRCQPYIERAIAMQQARFLEMKQQQKKKARAGSEYGDENIADDENDDDEKVFRIADMGCSSGPNCLANMHFMVEAVKKYHTSSSSCFELQAFFCDFPSNDFNTLFQLQHTRYDRARDEQDCFQAAVAGTVYGRLFPASSLHLVFSAWCLHWLSETPISVSIPSNLEWNKGKIWLDGGLVNEATGNAYAHQWQQDLNVFLKCRNKEMIIGGMLILVIPCRDDSFPSNQMYAKDNCFENLELSWLQLIQEGVLQQKDLDTFNLPIYLPTVQEIKIAILSIPNFQLQSLEVIKQAIGDNFWRQWGHDPEDLVRRVRDYYKCLTWNVIEGHVGTTKCASIFHRFTELLETSMQSRSYYDSYWAALCSSYAIVKVFKGLSS